jgi:hypothetical protein
MPTQPIGMVQNQPTDINFLNTHRFRLILSRAPNLKYFVQKCNLPAITVGNATQNTPFLDIPIGSAKIQYADLVCSFPVDEQMGNYKEIADWMIGINFPKEFGQYEDLIKGEGVYSDIALMVLDSNHQPIHVVKFRNAFPVSLSEIDFDSTVTDTVIPLVTVTFKYMLFEFDEVNADSTTVTQADELN